MIAAIVLCFVIGYLMIAFEHPLKLDKSVPALLIGVLTWSLISLVPQSLKVTHLSWTGSNETTTRPRGSPAINLTHLHTSTGKAIDRCLEFS